MTKFLFTYCPARGDPLSQIWNKTQPFVPGLVGRRHASFGSTSQNNFFNEKHMQLRKVIPTLQNSVAGLEI